MKKLLIFALFFTMVFLVSCKSEVEIVPVETPVFTSDNEDPFILLKDDGAIEDRFDTIAYMGSHRDGDDGSITIELEDTDFFVVGESSMRFSYKAPRGDHWAGIMFLWSPGAFQADPGDLGPNLENYSKITFYVRGNGGSVKFFAEFNGSPQATSTITLTDEWQQITLPISDNWRYNNIPFGWACNESNPDRRSSPITFWVDGIQFE